MSYYLACWENRMRGGNKLIDIFMDNSGYLHPLYPQSLREFGELLELPTRQSLIVFLS